MTHVRGQEVVPAAAAKDAGRGEGEAREDPCSTARQAKQQARGCRLVQKGGGLCQGLLAKVCHRHAASLRVQEAAPIRIGTTDVEAKLVLDKQAVGKTQPGHLEGGHNGLEGGGASALSS